MIGEPTSDIPLAREHFRKAEALLSKEPEGTALARLYIGIAQTSYTSRRTQREGLAAGKRAMEIAERFDDDPYGPMPPSCTDSFYLGPVYWQTAVPCWSELGR